MTKYLILFLFLTGCSNHKTIVEKPFQIKTEWQEGSTKSHETENDTIEIHFPANLYGPSHSGFNWASNLSPKDEYTISYEVKFANDFDFVKGGKLPGLCAGHGPAGVKPLGADKMSARIMWRRNGKVVSYVYNLEQKTEYGDDFTWTQGNKKLNFTLGKWHTIKFKVHLNSLNHHDGFIKGFMDGEMALDKNDLYFRTQDTLKIDRICFNTFFGGNDASWAPSKEQILWIRHLKIE